MSEWVYFTITKVRNYLRIYSYNIYVQVYENNKKQNF